MTKQYQYKNGGKPLAVADIPADKLWPRRSINEEGDAVEHRADGEAEPVYHPDYDLVEVGPWDHIKRGDPVVVRNDRQRGGQAEREYVRVFSHATPDRAYVLGPPGNPPQEVTHCRPATREELGYDTA